MKKLTLMSVMTILCFLAKAQPPALKPLTVGDTVPDIVFNHVINYKDSTAKLSDFKGKLVILDFWATWCGSCIKGFPEMDTIQSGFKNDIQFVLVNSTMVNDDAAKVQEVINRTSTLLKKPFRLPVAVEDSIADKYFDFTTLPHYVWIDKHGVVSAITGRKFITAEFIGRMISTGNIDLPVKVDVRKRHTK